MASILETKDADPTAVGLVMAALALMASGLYTVLVMLPTDEV